MKGGGKMKIDKSLKTAFDIAKKGKVGDIVDFKTEELELAEKIKLLWGFIWQLRPYRDYFDKMAKEAREKASYAVSAAVLNPFGYEVVEKKHLRVAKRAELLVKMIDVLEETDKDVLEAEKEKKKREKISKLFY